MAIGGKTLGIVSGLAVGLTSGVILAALNPIVPQKGEPAETQPIEEAAVAPAPEEKADPALPKLSMVDTKPAPETEEATTSETAVRDEAQISDVQEEPITEAEVPEIVEPKLVEPSVEPTLSAEVETLDPIEEPTIELAMVLPEESDDLNEETAPEQPSVAQSVEQPNVSTEPADAVALAESTLDTESPEVVATEITDSESVDVSEVADVEQAEEPVELAPVETVVTSLPTIEDPETPKPAVAVVEDAAENEPNTSGTFKTSGGSIITRGTSLPKIGKSEETGLASIGTGSGSRFKTIGDSAKITGETESGGDDTPQLGALARNANEFQVTSDPLMSVILIDDGKIASQLPSIQKYNLPLTIAVSLDEDDASERAAKYRDAGLEVLAMTPRNVKLSLTGVQSNEQVAQLLDQYFEIMPTSVGLIDRPSANLQKDQRLARAVVKHFGTTGHGLVTYAGGLNATKRIADQENVSSGAVFRFLDKSGEVGPIITQQLDRAALEARSKGAVIVMATPSAATLGTLVSWSLSSKARAVTFAPVSASLLKD